MIAARCSESSKEMSKSLVTIVGGAAGALVAVAMVISLVWLCKRKILSKNNSSDTTSSDPSAVVELNREGGGASSSAAAPTTRRGAHGAVQFTMEELEQATNKFNEINLIGYGRFGVVYKGLLRDGTLVAIKRRLGAPQHEFISEVVYQSEIAHRNLVNHLGYCQESGYQMIVYEFLPNGSVCNHLYNTGQQHSTTKLEFKQRVHIALGAAKGLGHLHSLTPPLPHKNFKTANVLVDENLIAKVADAGVSHLLELSVDVFQDPEIGESGIFSVTSDTYSFGVFLLELVTGREAGSVDALGSNESLIEWVKTCLSRNDFVDDRLVGSFTADGMRDLIRLALQCMSFPGKGRPRMQMVVSQLEQIIEKEMALTTVMGESTVTVTLGSELFTS